MGQQQLLLIVLGVIIVGVAVVVGISMFNSSAENAAKDSIGSEMLNIGAMAQQYYKRPSQLGGGGGTFVGFLTADLGNLADTDNATYVLSGQSATQIVVTATPKGGYSWSATVTVYATSIDDISGL